jgi:hypothetical protein
MQPLRFGDQPFRNELELELQLNYLKFDKTSAT